MYRGRLGIAAMTPHAIKVLSLAIALASLILSTIAIANDIIHMYRQMPVHALYALLMILCGAASGTISILLAVGWRVRFYRAVLCFTIAVFLTVLGVGTAYV